MLDHRHFTEALAAVQAHRCVQFPAQRGGALQQRRGAGLDAIGQQRTANQAVVRAVEIPEKPLGGVEPGHSPGFVPVVRQGSIGLPVTHAAHVAGTEVSA
ncbi:hypothetical protein D9M71_451430 [compost metagenome]